MTSKGNYPARGGQGVRAAGNEKKTRRTARPIEPDDLVSPAILDAVTKIAVAMRRSIPQLACHEVEDLVQFAFEAALKKAHTFRGESSIKTWISSVARNRLIDLSRRAALRPVPGGEALADVPAVEPVDESDLLGRRLELQAWLERPRGAWEVPEGARVLSALSETCADWEHVSRTLTEETGRPWTIESLKGTVRQIEQTKRGAALMAAFEGGAS